jgi:hypothetical protein
LYRLHQWSGRAEELPAPRLGRLAGCNGGRTLIRIRPTVNTCADFSKNLINPPRAEREERPILTRLSSSQIERQRERGGKRRSGFQPLRAFEAVSLKKNDDLYGEEAREVTFLALRRLQI